MWIFLSLFSALSESIKDAFGKVSSLKTNEYTSAIALHLVSLVLTIPVLFISGIPLLTSSFWWGSLAFLFITPAWSILYMKALKLSPLSITLPMMAFNPIFTALLAFLFKGETPSFLGWIGIVLISGGIYLVNLKRKDGRISMWQPLEHIWSDKGALCMLGVAFLWSLGAHFSKMRVDGSSATFSTFTGAVIGIVTTYFLSIILNKKISLKEFWSHSKQLMPVGFFYYLATITSSFALYSGSATYVFALKRASIVISSLAGKFYFKESFYVSKYIGLILIMLGIVMISI